MPPIPSVWHWHSLVARHAKSLREAANRVAKALDAQLKQSTQPTQQLETVLVRNTPKQPLHPLARIRQSQARWYSTARRAINDVAGSRSFTSSAGQRGGKRFDRQAFKATSQVGSFISQSTGRAPFASTLRPNLTGGTLGRTAGGYGLSGSGRVGGARYFSHAPAAQAQVVHNVSQAVRAFLTQGQKAQYDGVGPRGGKRYKAVSNLQEETSRKLRSLPKATPGSRIEFAVNPTITALTPLAALAGYVNESSDFSKNDHLNTSGLLNVLSVDFSRSLGDLAAVLADLKRLSSLGDLPITYTGTCLTVHFPGCDADSVDRLCDELGVRRGSVVQDLEFDDFAGTKIALLFPFAPSEDGSEDGEDLFDVPLPDYFQAAAKTKTTFLPDAARQVVSLADMFSSSLSDTPDAYSTQSDTGFETPEDLVILESPDKFSPWQFSSPSGFESVRSGSQRSSEEDPLEYQGFEGIYRFLGELEAVRR